MNNSQCTLEPNTLCTTHLTPGQIVGLILTAESGLVSVAAILILFFMIIKNVIRNMMNTPEETRRFFRTPLDVYMLSLFISDLIQGVGISFSIRWVARGVVECGSYCTAQGVIQQLGETTVAMATLAIAVHTFFTIFFRRLSQGILVPALVVAVIWLYVILTVAIGVGIHTKNGEHFDTPTPYWCWVGSKYTGERIAGEYFWFWFTALASLILYFLIFLCLRGNVDREGRGLGFRFRRRPKVLSPAPGLPIAQENQSLAQDLPRDSTDAAKKAFNMLLYPAAYVALILPLSIVRWIAFVLDAHHPPDPNNIRQNIPSAATLTVIAIFGLSGIVNVALILFTRPGLLLLDEPAQAAQRPYLGPFFASSESVVTGDVPPVGGAGGGPETLRLRQRTTRPAQSTNDDPGPSQSTSQPVAEAPA